MASNKQPASKKLQTLLSLYQSGQFESAFPLAKALTKKFPNHILAWKIISGIYRQTQKLPEALVAMQRVVKIDPSDAAFHNNIGTVYLDLLKNEQAQASFEKAIKLGYGGAYKNLTVALVRMNKADDLRVVQEHFIKNEPDSISHYLHLATLVGSNYEKAEAVYKEGLAIHPNNTELSIALGEHYRSQGKFVEAKAILSTALAANPGSLMVPMTLMLANTLFVLGENDKAKEYLDRLPDNPKTSGIALTIEMEGGNKKTILERLYKNIDKGFNDCVIGSQILRLNIIYGLRLGNPFCNDPLKFAAMTNLNTRYNFQSLFVDPVKRILDSNSLAYKQQSLLSNGIQTSGNIFKSADRVVELIHIEKIIRTEIDGYYNEFKNSNEGFIKNWPANYQLYGWLISMKSGGQLGRHFHENGWLSGSIYINIPPKKQADSGNLVLSQCYDMDEIECETKADKIIMNVETGSFCIFPASALHHTLAFESDEDRIVLAFDVIPIT